jgi:NAD+ diphosphatase
LARLNKAVIGCGVRAELRFRGSGAVFHDDISVKSVRGNERWNHFLCMSRLSAGRDFNIFCKRARILPEKSSHLRRFHNLPLISRPNAPSVRNTVLLHRMAPPPALPITPNADIESLLSRKYGREVTNYFAGSTLNRVSFLREDHEFLAQTVKQAQFTVFKDLAPLTKDSGSSLVFLTYDDVKDIIGENLFARSEKESISEFKPSAPSPILIFLGLDDTPESKPSFKSGRYSGVPVYALDVSLPTQGTSPVAAALTALVEKLSSKEGNTWSADRMFLSLPAQEAGTYAQARHLLDWHSRNPFCGTCGSRTIAVNVGWKRTCPPSHIAADGSTVTNPPCKSRHGVSNLSFPRTDAVIICAVISADASKILLGRQPRYPKGVYSTLAGFLEPGESVDEAVRREVWEEAGVQVGRVVVHSSQPWPYPANLMVGCIATALPDGETIDIGNDPELESAKWWSIADVRSALARASKVRGMGASDGTPQEDIQNLLWVPPQTAIAHVLMDAVCNGGFVGGSTKI